MKPALTLPLTLLLASLATQAAEPSADMLRDRGLPLVLFNNDSDDLKCKRPVGIHLKGVGDGPKVGS